MKRIPIDKATPGMVLAKPVESSTGAILFAQGMELDEKAISRLKSLDIDFITIEGHTEPRMSKKRYLEIVERAFSKAEKTPVMRELRKTLLNHIETLYEEA